MTGALPLLVALLKSSELGTQRAAVKALRNLMCNCQENKDLVVAAGEHARCWFHGIGRHACQLADRLWLTIAPCWSVRQLSGCLVHALRSCMVSVQ